MITPQINSPLSIESCTEVQLPSKTYKLNHDVNNTSIILDEPTNVVGDNIKLDNIAYDKMDLNIEGNSYQLNEPSVAYKRAEGETLNLENITLLDTDNWEIKGNSIQEGTPSINSEAPVESVGDNINRFDSTLETQTINGVTVSYDENDGTLTFNGTATANGGGYLFTRYPSGTTMAELKANETYSASLNVISGSFVADTSQTENSSIQFWRAWDYSFQLMFANISNNQLIMKRTPTSDVILANIQLKIVKGDVFNNFKIAIKFEEGEVTPYSPYGQGSIEVYNCNKNLFNLDDFTETSAGVTITKTGDTFVLNGTATNNNTLVYTPPEILKLLGDYTLSVKYISGTKSGTCNFNIRDYNTNSGIIGTNLTTSDTYNTKTFEETTQIRFGMYINGGSTFTDYTFKVQLEKGLTATDYTPHQGQTKALYTQQPFRAIGDVKDRFVKQNGVEYEEHPIGRYVFTGKETLYAVTTANGFISFNYISKSTISAKSTIAMSNMLKYNNDIWNIKAEDNVVKIRETLDGITIMIKGITTVDDLKAKLVELYNAGTPVYVDYVLATPTLIECTPEQVEALEELNNSKLYEGTTHIYSTDSISPIIALDYDGYDGTPSLRYPSEVESCGDNIQLFDKDNITEKHRLDSEGLNYYQVDYFVSDYIPVKEKTEYVKNTLISTMQAVSYYDKDKNHIERNTTKNPFTTPEGTCYIRTCDLLTNLDILKLEKGTKASPYSPYGQGSIEIKQVNKNFFDGIAEQGALNADGWTADSTTRVRMNKRVFLKKGSYTINANGSEQVAVYFYNDTTTKAESNSGWVNTPYTFTITTDKYVCGAFRKADSSAVTINNINNIQIEKGSTATDYTPHQGQTKALYTQQPFRAIGEVKDRFVKQNGVCNEKHNIGRYIFTGNEGWAYNETYKYFYCPNFVFEQIPSTTNKNQISNRFVVTSSWSGFRSAIDTNMMYSVQNDGYKICVRNLNYSNIDDFSNWLSELYNAGTPLYVDYVLATPNLIPCTPEQVEVLEKIEAIRLPNDIVHIYSTDAVGPTFNINYYSSEDIKFITTDVDRIIGFVDNVEAVKQSIYHILNTERYAYLIYGENYGIELEQYIGRDMEYIKATIGTTLREALTYDLRVKDVIVNNIIQVDSNSVAIDFTAITIYGNLVLEVTVNV